MPGGLPDRPGHRRRLPARRRALSEVRPPGVGGRARGWFTFRLRQGDKRLGALDLYRTTPGLVDADAMGAAQTLADVAAAYLNNVQARADLRDSSDRYKESALRDALTGLPNRVLFGQRVDHAVLRARRSGKLVALLFADLDRFRDVNDVHGHQTGDDLLIGVAERLTAALRLQRHLRKAYDYPDGVRVSFRWVLFLTRWIWTTWPSKRRPALISAVAELASDAEVIHLRTRRQVRTFLEGVRKPG